jgi:hypothetical protein
MKIKKMISLDEDIVREIKKRGLKLSTITNQMLLVFLDPNIELVATKKEKTNDQEHRREETSEIYTRRFS